MQTVLKAGQGNTIAQVVTTVLLLLTSCFAGAAYQTRSETLPIPILSAFYLLNENGGTKAHDASGHGNDATLTNGSCWSRIGITTPLCTLSLPAPLVASAAGIGIWYRMKANISTGQGMWLFGTNGNTSIVAYGNLFGAMVLQDSNARTFGGVAAPMDRNLGNTSVNVVLGSPAQMFIDGAPPIGYTAQATLKSFSASSWATVGSYKGAFGFNGDVYAVAIYSTPPTAVEISRVDRYVREQKPEVRFDGDGLDHKAPILICGGDSIQASFGPTYLPASTMCNVAAQIANPRLQVFNLGVGGAQTGGELKQFARSTTALMRSFSGPEIYWEEAGTNDLDSGASASKVIANKIAICTAVKAVNPHAKCIISTILPRRKIIGAREAARIEVNSALLTRWRAGELQSVDYVVDFDQDPNASLWTSYVDGTHPRSVLNLSLAPRVAAAITMVSKSR